jgi:branched-chain amino acid transport system ATP-binding protein
VTGDNPISPAKRVELRMEDVVAGYLPGHPVLRGVTLRAAPGKLTVLLGPNGAGKSTVLKVLSGFLAPAAGRVTANGTDISPLPDHRHLELGIALLQQGRSVFADLTVAENLELGGWLWRANRTRLRRGVEAALARYPALAEMRRRAAGSLSGGQQRTLEIARLLVTSPHTLLIDEPSAGLSDRREPSLPRTRDTKAGGPHDPAG